MTCAPDRAWVRRARGVRHFSVNRRCLARISRPAKHAQRAGVLPLRAYPSGRTHPPAEMVDRSRTVCALAFILHVVRNH